MLRVALVIVAAVAALAAGQTPERVRCGACHRLAAVELSRSHFEDPQYVAFRDDCDYLHFHDASYDEVTYQCRRCGYTWSEQHATAPPCWCGWKRGDSGYHDPCTPVEDPDDDERNAPAESGVEDPCAGVVVEQPAVPS